MFQDFQFSLIAYQDVKIKCMYNIIKEKIYQIKLKKLFKVILADKYSSKIQIDRFLEILKEQDDLITEFFPKLLISIVDIIEVFSIREIKVHFKNGEIVVVNLLKRKK